MLLERCNVITTIVVRQSSEQYIMYLLPYNVLKGLLLQITRCTIRTCFRPFTNFMIGNNARIRTTMMIFRIRSAILYRVTRTNEMNHFFHAAKSVRTIVNRRNYTRRFIVPINVNVRLRIFRVTSRFNC